MGEFKNGQSALPRIIVLDELIRASMYQQLASFLVTSHYRQLMPSCVNNNPQGRLCNASHCTYGFGVAGFY